MPLAGKTLTDAIAFNNANAEKEMPFFGQEIFELTAAIVAHGGAEPVGDRERLAAVRDDGAVREALGGLRRGARVVVEGAFPFGAAREVVRQCLVEFRETVGVELLDRAPDGAVQLAPPFRDDGSFVFAYAAAIDSSDAASPTSARAAKMSAGSRVVAASSASRMSSSVAPVFL